MNVKHRRLLDNLMIHSAQTLDITPTQYESAIEKYGAVGRWLGDPGSPLDRFEPLIFAQGSMALGTATKPVGRDEFDLDLVCQLQVVNGTHPWELKHAIGARLRNHETYKSMLVEKNRCWRLVYAGEFHMDILPATPDTYFPNSTALLVPDKELQSWKETDPKGYSTWFKERASISAVALETQVLAKVEPPPPEPVGSDKLPLQIAVQLLKRHRDLMFSGDNDAPISIIITTLAARAYDGTQSVFDCLSGLLQRMPLFIETTVRGEPLIANPVNRHENFADKWAGSPRKQHFFNQWILQAREDLRQVEKARLADMAAPLGSWVDKLTASQALRDYAESIQRQRSTGLKVLSGTGAIASPSVVANTSPKHTFYGR